MSGTPKILLLTSDGKEASDLGQLLSNYAILACATNLSELHSRLNEGHYDAVFCARRFYQDSWSGSFREIRERHPDLPVIVLYHGWGEREWMEVVESGAFDLLALPCQKPTVLAVVEQAVVSHEARKARKSAGIAWVENQAS